MTDIHFEYLGTQEIEVGLVEGLEVLLRLAYSRRISCPWRCMRGKKALSRHI